MNLAQTIYDKVQTMSPQKMQQVLDFVEFLSEKSSPQTSKSLVQLPITHYAGMVKLPKTGKPRSLFDFDVASVATSS